MHALLAPVVILCLLCQPQEPPRVSRTVKDNILTSADKPAVKLKFDRAYKYIGSQSFILYGVATAEQHFFVDADEQNRVRRLYWIQFESYLPDNKHVYNYQSKQRAKIGPLEFIADSNPRNLKNPVRPDSDSAKTRAFLAAKGYQMASMDVLSQRLVHLLDDKKRDELMMIYLEDLTPLNLTAADLAPGGKAADQWQTVSKQLLERALQGVTVIGE